MPRPSMRFSGRGGIDRSGGAVQWYSIDAAAAQPAKAIGIPARRRGRG